jgi:diacylglycerol kinase
MAFQRGHPRIGLVSAFSPPVERPARMDPGNAPRSGGTSSPAGPEKTEPEFKKRRVLQLWLLIGLSLIAANIPWQFSIDRIGRSGIFWLYRLGGYLSLFLGFAAVLVVVVSVEIEKASGLLDRIHQDLAGWMRISEQQIPLVAGSVAFALLAAAAAGDRPLMFNPAVALAAWGAGIILAVAGFWSSAPKERNIRSAAVWALLFSLAALLIRLPSIDLPPFCADEASTGLDALMFLRGTANTFFRDVGFHSFAGLYFFLEAGSIQVLGRTVLAVRILSVVSGALTVGLLYLTGRALFGHRTGVVAAILLAVSHFHLAFSHLGLNNIWDALIYSVFAGAVWYAWRSERRNAFLLTGLALGFSLYFYTTARLAWVLALGWMVLVFFLDRSRFRRNGGGWIGLWIAAGVTVLPIVFYIIARPGDYIGHTLTSSIFFPEWLQKTMDSSGSSLGEVLWNQFLNGFGAFAFFPSKAWYTPGTPILRPVEAAFFLAGFVFLALRPRDPRSGLLIGWIGMFGVIGALSIYAPSSQRYVGSAPVCALLTAFGLVKIQSHLEAFIPSARRGAAVALPALILFIACDNLHFSFADYFPNTRYHSAYDFEGAGIAYTSQVTKLVQARDDSYQVVFLPGGVVETRYILFFVPDVRMVFFQEPYGSLQNPSLDASHLLFIVPTVWEKDMDQLRKDYPGGTAGAAYNWDGMILFFYYDVAAVDE